MGNKQVRFLPATKLLAVFLCLEFVSFIYIIESMLDIKANKSM